MDILTRRAGYNDRRLVKRHAHVGTLFTMSGRCPLLKKKRPIFSSVFSFDAFVIGQELDFSEDDAEVFFRIECCSPDTVYARGVVKQRLRRASVYD